MSDEIKVLGNVGLEVEVEGKKYLVKAFDFVTLSDVIANIARIYDMINKDNPEVFTNLSVGKGTPADFTKILSPMLGEISALVAKSVGVPEPEIKSLKVRSVVRLVMTMVKANDLKEIVSDFFEISRMIREGLAVTPNP